jgi:hypothetical protein
MARPNIVPWDRSGHGTGRGAPRIEVPPVEEGAKGTPAPQPSPQAMPRPPYAAGSPEAREAGRRGGKESAERNALADELGLNKPADEPRRRRAEAFRKAEVRHLKRNIGGGKLSPGARLMVKLAAWGGAAAEKAFEEGRDADGNKLAEGVRQNLLAAHAKAAKEADPATLADADRAVTETFGRKGAPRGS